MPARSELKDDVDSPVRWLEIVVREHVEICETDNVPGGAETYRVMDPFWPLGKLISYAIKLECFVTALAVNPPSNRYDQDISLFIAGVKSRFELWKSNLSLFGIGESKTLDFEAQLHGQLWE